MEHKSDNGQAGDPDGEIEITPEMIKAGRQAYYEWEDSDEPSVWVLIEKVMDAALAASRKDSGPARIS